MEIINLQKLLQQMPLFENPHFSIEGDGFVKYTPWGIVKLLMEQSARFGNSKPSCHILENLEDFEIQLFDRVNEPLKEDVSLKEESVLSIESSFFEAKDKALPYREIIIKLKRHEGE